MVRLWGEDRVGTALAVSQRGWSSSDEVVLATGWGFADALAGGGLAAKLEAPLLLSAPGSLSEGVTQELERLGARRVWLLGGTAAISHQVEQTLDGLGYATPRLAGSDRFATAVAVARAVGAPSGEVVLALGAHDEPGRQAWPDALAAGALLGTPGGAGPVLLTGSDELPAVTRQALADLGVQQVTVVGGTSAIGEGVVAQLRGHGYQVQRVAGSSRYGTSVAAATLALSRHGTDGKVPTVFVTGQSYPDGLAGGGLAAQTGAIVVLVPPDDLAHAPEIVGFLDEHGHRLDPRLVLGGTSAISDHVYDQLSGT